MPGVNSLLVPCSRCKVAATCPRRGSSPAQQEGLRKPLFCRIVGGYGREPVDPARLSEAARARAAVDGPCATFVDVPTKDLATGLVTFEAVTVFHHPVRHPRETVDAVVDRMFPSGHKP